VSLTLGFYDFDKQETRSRREKLQKAEIKDRDVRPPDLYTHHDNAIRAQTKLKAVVGGTHLKPNLRFDNSPPRDNSMYNLSDLSNLNHDKLVRRTNELDEYMDIENILPHQNTLARGYQKGSHYDYIVSGSKFGGSDRYSNSNFHSKRLSESKVANVMRDTLT
jgi:hypothetical protein